MNVISKLTRCRLLAILGGLVLTFITAFAAAVMASRTEGLISVVGPWELLVIRMGSSWLVFLLLAFGLASIMGTYDLLVVVTCMIPGLLYFAGNYAINVSMYLPDDGHTFHNVMGGVPPFYFWGHFWILCCSLAWGFATACAALVLKRWWRGEPIRAELFPTGSLESRALCRSVIFDTGFLLLAILLVLFIDLQLQIRKGRPDVILAHVTEVLDAPTSTPMDRTLALHDLHWNLDRFHNGDLSNTLTMLRRELGTQPEPTKLEVAIVLIQCHDLSGLPLIEESLMHPSAEMQGTGLFSAMDCLQGINDPSALPTLELLMSAPDAATRRSAVQALRHTRSPAAIGTLLKALDDPDYEVRRFSSYALVEILDRHREYGWKHPAYHPGRDGEEMFQANLAALKAWAIQHPQLSHQGM